MRSYTAIGVLAIIAFGTFASMARSTPDAVADTGHGLACGEYLAIETQWEGSVCVDLKHAAFFNAAFPCQEDEALIHTGAPEANPSSDGIACVHLDILANNAIVDAVNECAVKGMIVAGGLDPATNAANCALALRVMGATAWALPDDGSQCYVTRSAAGCYPPNSNAAFPIGLK